jgi:hypothetical protein
MLSRLGRVLAKTAKPSYTGKTRVRHVSQSIQSHTAVAGRQYFSPYLLLPVCAFNCGLLRIYSLNSIILELIFLKPLLILAFCWLNCCI